MKKLTLTILAVLVVVGGATGFVLTAKDEPKPTSQTSSTPTVQQTPKKEVSYKGVEGKNALELLKQSHKVETKSYAGLGELVTSIDGLAADSKHFWSLYVNGQQSQVGAGSYIAKDTDVIVWKLEEIQ